jgi:hypothetical protein
LRNRRDPRISLNQLTEYLVATPARKRTILRQQKYPSAYQTIYYQEAQDTIQRFITEDLSNEEILLSAIDDICSRSFTGSYEKNKNASNAEALESFYDFYKNINLLNFRPLVAPDDQPKILVGNVNLSVRPEILLSDGEGKVAGAIKLYFSKRSEAYLDDRSGKYPSAILYEYLRRQNPDCKPLQKACIVIDVFNKRQFSAPKSYTRALRDIEVTCEDIAILWSHI